MSTILGDLRQGRSLNVDTVGRLSEVYRNGTREGRGSAVPGGGLQGGGEFGCGFQGTCGVASLATGDPSQGWPA